jgi:hypothetical protein
MENFKNRNGQDRTFQRVTYDKVRVIGESFYNRKSVDNRGETTMFDFEGGPAFNIGAKIKFEKMEWKINAIQPETVRHEHLASIILYVTPIY